MSNNKNISHNDDPALQDLLNHEQFIINLCSVIANCKPPKALVLTDIGEQVKRQP